MTLDSPLHHLTPEEALRRHELGDRSPDVIKALTQAAWEAYHAPWEPPFMETPMAEGTPKDSPTASEIRALSMALLDAWVQEDGAAAFRHPTRGYLIDYKFGLKSDRCVQLRIYISGKEGDILVLQWVGDKRLPPDQFFRGLRFCDWWNNEYRWPRAMVDQDYRYTDAISDPPPSKEDVEAREATHSAHLMLGYQVGLPAGIHQEGLNAMIDRAIDSSWTFWRLAHENWGL